MYSLRTLFASSTSTDAMVASGVAYAFTDAFYSPVKDSQRQSKTMAMQVGRRRKTCELVVPAVCNSGENCASLLFGNVHRADQSTTCHFMGSRL
jgi:hypothetical protein